MPARTRALALVASTVLFGALAPSPGGAQEADPASADAAPVEGSPGETGATRRPVRGYLQLGWRVMGLAEHVGHGPDLGFGAVLYDVVKIGFVTFQRPGPINPSTFDYDLPDGSYKGQTSLTLRSDGSFLGLAVTPYVELPVLAGLRLELPVAFGYGAFGFYLTGDDRDTPDGRRVSEWEDELLDGGDASGGLALDVGLRVAFGLPGVENLKPYAAFQYTRIFGYDATLRSSYDGPSGSVGVLIETP